MLGEDRNYHGWVFGALGFVYGDCIRQNNLVKVGKIIGYIPPVKRDGYLLVLRVYPCDSSDIPVEDLLIVIVFDLHDLVIDTKVPVTPYHPVFSWIKRLLQFCFY